MPTVRKLTQDEVQVINDRGKATPDYRGAV